MLLLFLHICCIILALHDKHSRLFPVIHHIRLYFRHFIDVLRGHSTKIGKDQCVTLYFPAYDSTLDIGMLSPCGGYMVVLTIKTCSPFFSSVNDVRALA